MKTFIKMIMVAGIFSFLSIMANAVYAKEEIPPKAVEISFNQRFPGAEHVTWKKYLDNQYLASFILNETEINAFYSKTGAFIESDILLTDSAIPELITDQLTSIRNYVLYYVLETTDSKNNEYYRVKIKVENVLYELDFDKNLNMISKTVL
jgi:hypothetical protein